ncbi:helix-turn-helix domain-containing protein [Streptomyces sp. NPDC056160]|uniref:helix-turn-helix domain-containing protein n=1 Tax=Streptomyces sp. NPDC056160 TaxID=3345731 RepID=UPI0035D85349
MEAAERFRQGDENPVIAHDLRVSVRSVQRWRRAWSQNGPRALASKGPASLPLLSDELFAALERELARGPVAHGWPDQTWTLSRIKTLIGRRCRPILTCGGAPIQGSDLGFLRWHALAPDGCLRVSCGLAADWPGLRGGEIPGTPAGPAGRLRR